MDSAAMVNEAEARDRDEFINRLFSDALGAFNIFAIHLGDRLGFYKELSKNASLSTELHSTGTYERYVRDGWSSRHAVCWKFKR
jgi:hypothetical protein